LFDDSAPMDYVGTSVSYFWVRFQIFYVIKLPNTHSPDSTSRSR
jgi:hypothetical protein